MDEIDRCTARSVLGSQIRRTRGRPALMIVAGLIITSSCGSGGLITISDTSTTTTSTTTTTTSTTTTSTTTTTTTTTVPVVFSCPDVRSMDSLLATAAVSPAAAAAGQVGVRTKTVTCFGHWAVGSVGEPEQDASANFAGYWIDGTWRILIGFNGDICAELARGDQPAAAAAARLYMECDAVEAAPSCSVDALTSAWNARFPMDPYGYSIDDPKCDGDVAVGFAQSLMPDSEGNPDFGNAVFVWRGGAWAGLERFRTPGYADIESLGLTADQQRRVIDLLGDACCR